MLCKKDRLPRALRLLYRREEGQSLVEFAVILPALILMLLAIIQFGAIFTGLLALNAAAREGARQAAVGEDAKTAVERVYPLGLFLGGLDPEEDIEVIYPEGKAAGKPVRVTVSGEVLQFIPLPHRQAGPVEDPEGYIVESPLKFQATAVMRMEEEPANGDP